MVVARNGDEQVKVLLDQRFQDAIDQAAMLLGDTDADDYLAGWTRDPWSITTGSPVAAAASAASALEDEWTPERIAAYLAQLP